MNPDEIRAQCEAAWAERDHVTERESALQELDAGPRANSRAVELRDRQPRVVVDDERKAA